MYKVNDKVVFKVGTECFEYTVHCRLENNWYLDMRSYSNSIIFAKLNIVDKFKFVKDISKYATDDRSASFPEIRYPDETEINKVINALLKKCDEYNKLNNTMSLRYKDRDKTEEKTSTEITLQKPIFKEGDYVRVIFRKNVKDSDCYRFGFVEDMLQYCGDIFIVHNVSYCVSEAKSEPDDGMLYRLKTIAGTQLAYNFASSMLMPVRNIIPPQSPFLERIKLDYPFIGGCIQTTVDSETKTVSKKSTPKYKLKKYKLKFTN